MTDFKAEFGTSFYACKYANFQAVYLQNQVFEQADDSGWPVVDMWLMTSENVAETKRDKMFVLLRVEAMWCVKSDETTNFRIFL